MNPTSPGRWAQKMLTDSDLAYGDAGSRTIPGGAVLIFEVELLEVVGVPPWEPPGASR